MHGLKKRMSDQTAQLVDSEHSRILDEQYNRARTILEENRDKVEAMTKALIEWETIDATQIEDIMAGREPKPPADTPSSPSANSGDDENDSAPTIEPRMDKPASES